MADQQASVIHVDPGQELAFPLSYTYSYSKYSCIAGIYPIHILMNYLIILIGLLAMGTRIFPRFHWLHVWFGRMYIVAMFYSFASSLLIHNTGLPLPIIFFFLILLLSLTIGWISIKFHENNMMKESYKRVEVMINQLLEMKGKANINIMVNEETTSHIDLQHAINTQKAQVFI